MSISSATILRLFRDASGGFVSGQTASRELKVSRAAVWKHVSALRAAGYVIEAVPSRGYRMISAPEVFSSDEISVRLVSSRMGRQLFCVMETYSTNTDAFRLAEQGASEGTVILADFQSGGKGRLGRQWVSPAGVNLYCSVVLRPHVKPFEAPQLTFLSAVAVAVAIEETIGLAPAIKWPNDVLIGEKKVAGLLNEMSAETDGVNFVILGIGVNLNMTAEQFPYDLRQPATSLLIESGRRIDRTQFTACLLNGLDCLYVQFLEHGFGPVREEWQKRCNAYGKEVVVTDGETVIMSGAFEGIDEDGALLVRRKNGLVERNMSGDVRVIRNASCY